MDGNYSSSVLEKSKTTLTRSASASYLNANQVEEALTQSAMNFETDSCSMSIKSGFATSRPKDWQPNMTAPNCQVCDVKFNVLFRRKHHCRQCGNLVCNGCSQTRDYVSGYKDTKVRICNICSNAKLEL